MATALARNKQKRPVDIFRTTLLRLTTPLGQEPNFTNVTNLLLGGGLITKPVLDGITSQPNLTDKQRGSKVAHALLDEIEASDDPVQCLHKICDVLEDEKIEDEHLRKHGDGMRSQLPVTRRLRGYGGGHKDAKPSVPEGKGRVYDNQGMVTDVGQEIITKAGKLVDKREDVFKANAFYYYRSGSQYCIRVRVGTDDWYDLCANIMDNDNIGDVKVKRIGNSEADKKTALKPFRSDKL